MKTYYQDEAVTIYHGDCREIIPELPMVDLVLTDPPYNIAFGNYRSYKDNLSANEYISMLSLLSVFPKVVISHYAEETMQYIIPALGIPCHVGAWCYHTNTQRRFRLVNYYGIKPNYNRIHQPYRNPSDKRIKKQMAKGKEGTALYEWWDDIEIVKNVSEEKTEHPCPLPEDLVGRIIILITEQSQVILDPFLGSGTTAFCAKKLNRKCIGIEVEEKYCEIAATRCSQGVMQLA